MEKSIKIHSASWQAKKSRNLC